MIPIGHGVKGLARERIGVFFIGAQASQNLCADTLNRVRIKSRLMQGGAQQIDACIAVFRQKPRRYGDVIRCGAIAETGRQSLQTARKAAGIQIARPLFEQCGHHVHCAAFIRRVQRSPTTEPQFECGERDAVIFDQPSLDATGAGHLDNVDICAQGESCEKSDTQSS